MMSASTWTIEQWVEHGRRWLAAGWTWKRGQIALAEDDDGRWRTLVVTGVAANARPLCYGAPMPSGAVPDLRDPGTRGHALALVRELWKCPDARAEHPPDGWRIVGRLDWLNPPRLSASAGHTYVLGIPGAPTEHEALLAAREAAP